MAQSGDLLNESTSKEPMRTIRGDEHRNKSMQEKSAMFAEECHTHKEKGTELGLGNSGVREWNGDYGARMFLRRIYDRAES